MHTDENLTLAAILDLYSWYRGTSTGSDMMYMYTITHGTSRALRQIMPSCVAGVPVMTFNIIIGRGGGGGREGGPAQPSLGSSYGLYAPQAVVEIIYPC